MGRDLLCPDPPPQSLLQTSLHSWVSWAGSFTRWSLSKRGQEPGPHLQDHHGAPFPGAQHPGCRGELQACPGQPQAPIGQEVEVSPRGWRGPDRRPEGDVWAQFGEGVGLN